ncbi:MULTISPECIES: hypothetical protein [unclassified Rathayibacter]|nr:MULTISPECIES: hypothetical protein [unclassified Rathayibacter]
MAELSEQFGATRSAVYRAVERSNMTELRAVDVTLPLPEGEQ